ncbi:MAG: DUF192 domain-containing protein [Bdellovibrionia bacterium]
MEFKKAIVQVNDVKIDVELAETAAQQARGLMFRKSLDQGSGMLFIFEEERTLSFWMKNTFIPLSIAYINKDKKIVDIQDMTPVKSVMEENPPSYPSKRPAQYALEVNQGFFKKHKIKVGDTIKVLKQH